MGERFIRQSFEERIDAALATVRTVLDTNKRPQRAANCPHTYEDKYHIVERSGRNATIATLTALRALGASGKVIDAMLVHALNKRSVTLRFESSESCTFVKKESRDVESKVKYVTEKERSITGRKSKKVDKTVTTVTEFFWDYDYEYSLYAYPGGDVATRIEFFSGKASTQLITSSKSHPYPRNKKAAVRETSMDWLLKTLIAPDLKTTTAADEIDDLTVSFTIDREDNDCHTPTNNKDFRNANSFFSDLALFCINCHNYFSQMRSVQTERDGMDYSALDAETIFVPVLPILLAEKGGEGEAQAQLPATDEKELLKEQRRQLQEKLDEVDVSFKDASHLVTKTEAKFMVAFLHCRKIYTFFSHMGSYVEYMIENQLVEALGKSVTAKEFGEYMEFHYRKMFAKQYAPGAFVYAVRRPNACPEGVLTIEKVDTKGGEVAQPVQTFSCTRIADASTPLYLQMGVTSRVPFVGEQTVHATIIHSFSHDSDIQQLQLNASARQFSCFVLMVGSMTSADTFKAEHAILLQNKDDLLIPLMLESMPSAKQFRDAIESLSPEQQRFAKAYRSMQLDSSLFSLCVVQIKPQLEELLELPSGSLIKEIELTQAIMDLFTSYQVPSDLISYGGPEDKPVEFKVDAVRQHVANLKKLIADAKEKQIKEAADQAMYDALNNVPKATTVKIGREIVDTSYLSPPSAPVASLSIASPSSSSISTHARSAKRARSPTRLSFVTTTTTTSSKAGSGSVGSIVQSVPPQNDAIADNVNVVVDYTKMPRTIDARLDVLNAGSIVRPTKISAQNVWTKTHFKSILSKKPDVSPLAKDELKVEKDRAFDLLDALSRSGSLTLNHTSLHIVLASTHTFVRSLVDTVCKNNVNPIEKAEATAAIITGALHNCSPMQVLHRSEKSRIAKFSPLLLTADETNEDKVESE